ncbi:MAG: DUF4105 domain-containing protein [Muribaculaceae bacterium]|nr:DUF4105 domain-containing protein [Muribaculaceae bacterium]
MQRLHRYIVTLLCMIACALPARAITPRLQASLITCYPGPEVYELVGHEALRIHGTTPDGLAMDSVWNYGVFDFAAPNFIYRFVKGETDYMVYGYPFSFFMPQYVERGSRVVEQQLNLTPGETLDLLKRLQINALEPNRTYRYNYVRDNCSTRVAAMLDSAVAPRRIIYPDSVSFGSFRDAMRTYHTNYPWYQFGIDLALGSGIDHELTPRQEIFAPLRLMQLAAYARFSGDGKPLVSRTVVLYPGRPGAVLPPTPGYLTPMAAGILILLLSIVVSIMECRRRRIIRWWMSLWFTILGLCGCVIWFLVFVSTHDSTSPNLLFLWLNPLQLVIGAGVWCRVMRPAVMAMAIVDMVVLLLLALIWPFQAQSANPAVFPMWASTVILCCAYTLVYNKDKYHNG